MNLDEIDIQISELETRIDRLRALYEQYFMGFERTEPSVPRKDVERRIQDLRKVRFNNTAKRFKFQTLIQRYNTMQQYWGRICREIENGTYKRHKLKAERTIGSLDPSFFDDTKRNKLLQQATEEAPPAEEKPARTELGNLATEAAELLDAGADLDAELERALEEATKKPAVGGLLSRLGKREGEGDARDVPLPPAIRPKAAPPAVPPLPAKPQPKVGAELRAPSGASPASPGATSPGAASPGAASSGLASLGPVARAPAAPRPAVDPLVPAARTSVDPVAPAPRAPVAPAPSSAAAPAPPPRPESESKPQTRIPSWRPIALTDPPKRPRTPVPPGAPSPVVASVTVPITHSSSRPAPPPDGVSAPSHKPVTRAVAPPPRTSTAAGPSLGPPARPAPRPASFRPPRREVTSTLSEDQIRSIHEGYLRARAQTNASPVSYEKLAKSLRETEAQLLAKSNGRKVDFEVVIESGRAMLKPKLK